MLAIISFLSAISIHSIDLLASQFFSVAFFENSTDPSALTQGRLTLETNLTIGGLAGYSYPQIIVSM